MPIRKTLYPDGTETVEEISDEELRQDAEGLARSQQREHEAIQSKIEKQLRAERRQELAKKLKAGNLSKPEANEALLLALEL